MMVTLFAYAYAVGERSSRGGAVTEQHAWTVLWFANGLCTRRRVFRDATTPSKPPWLSSE
jgi:hypothetical protein